MRIEDYLITDEDRADYKRLQTGSTIEPLNIVGNVRTFMEDIMLHMNPEEARKNGYIFTDNGKYFSIQQ